MTLQGRRNLLARADRALLVSGAVSVGAVLAVLLPWLRSDPPAGLSFSNSPYTDEGLYNSAARSMALFGSFGRQGLFRQLTDSSYTLATSAVFSVTGPSIVAARALSVVSVCAMVLLALWGLKRLLGLPSALIVAAGIGGSQLLLLYGHMAIVEPFESALLFAGFVAMAHGLSSGKWPLGALAGVLLAAAMAAKFSALLAFPAVIGVPLLACLIARAWWRMLVPAAAAGTVLVLTGIWALAVALPNRADFNAGMKTLSGTGGRAYPRGIGAVVQRLSHWLHHPALTDHALAWARPLLIAAAFGTVVSVALWRRFPPVHRWVLATGLLWAGVCWAVPVLSGYSPNRYFVVAVPGLALAAGAGLGAALQWAAGRTRWGRPAWAQPVAGAVLALLVAVPGVVAYLRMESTALGSHQLAADERAVAGALPPGSVLYGIYAPDMAFSDRVRVVIPWPQSGLHMRSPVQRYGVQYVIADISPARTATDLATLQAVSGPGHPLGTPVLTVAWGPHRLAVYRVGPPPPGR